MKLLGFMLLLAGGIFLRSELLRAYRERLALGEELCRGLDELRREIFRRQRPLPEVLRRCREKSRYSGTLWEGLLTGIALERGFSGLWEEQCALLPPPYDALLQGLGAVVAAGEQEEALVLTREELRSALAEQRKRKGERDRLVTAMCLCVSVLVGVVLL